MLEEKKIIFQTSCQPTNNSMQQNKVSVVLKSLPSKRTKSAWYSNLFSTHYLLILLCYPKLYCAIKKLVLSQTLFNYADLDTKFLVGDSSKMIQQKHYATDLIKDILHISAPLNSISLYPPSKTHIRVCTGKILAMVIEQQKLQITCYFIPRNKHSEKFSFLNLIMLTSYGNQSYWENNLQTLKSPGYHHFFSNYWNIYF